MKFLVISCSLNPESRSRELAHVALQHLQAHGADAGMLDLLSLPLPMCDGAAASGDPQVEVADAQIKAADGFLVATPIYNFHVNSAAKNLLELTGDSWSGKVAG